MIKKLITWKMYWNRAMSHLSVPLGVFEKMALLVLLLKMFDIFNIATVVISGVLLVGGTFLIGYIDVRFKIYETETSINNQYNPELKKIIRQTRRKTK